MSTTLVYVLVSSLAGGIIAVLLAGWIAGFTSRPVQDLTRAVTQMAGGRITPQNLPTSVDEIGQLTKAFNSMAVQLNNQFSDLEMERGNKQEYKVKRTAYELFAQETQ